MSQSYVILKGVQVTSAIHQLQIWFHSVMILALTVGSGTYQGFLSIKAKLSFAISAIKSLLESKCSAWMTGRKGNNHRELGFVLPLPIVWCSRSPGPSCLWDGPSGEHSHTFWMLLPFSCPGVVCDQSKPWCNKLLRFSFFSMKDTMTFTILSLLTTSFSVRNDISYTFYHTLYIFVKVIRFICAAL